MTNIQCLKPSAPEVTPTKKPSPGKKPSVHDFSDAIYYSGNAKQYYIEPGHTRLVGGTTEDGTPGFTVSVGELDCREYEKLPEDELQIPVFGMNFHDLAHFKAFVDNIQRIYELVAALEEGENK